MRTVLSLLLALSLATATHAAPTPPAKGQDTMLVYIGTYSRGGSQGVYVYRFDPATGKLEATGLTAPAQNPSFLALHPSGRFLYAVNEADLKQDVPGGAVSAFAIDPRSGALTLLNRQASRGTSPCHLAVDKTGRCLLVANYGSGSIALLPIEPDGRLGAASAVVQHEGSSVDPGRQKGPHAHSCTISPDNRFAFACDLGLDKVLAYRLDPAHGTLAPNEPAWATIAPGTGPRHMAFHPNGRFAYVMSEMGSSVTAFAYNADRGVLTALQSLSALPDGFTGHSSGADIHVAPSGRFLYASNRGHDSIAIFGIDPATGKLTLVGHQPSGGHTPRNFALDPSGHFLLAANQDSNSVVVFRIDEATGLLTPTGQVETIPSPVCVTFLAQ